MPERPLLIHSYPEDAEVPKGHGGGKMPPKPFMGVNRRRTFSEKFNSAINYIQNIVGNVNPEMVLVIETIGKIQDFHKAIRRIDGLDWLAEADIDDLEIDDDAYEKGQDKEKARKSGGRLYLISSNKSGLDSIFSLWKKYVKGDSLPYGYGKWKEVFIYIYEIRYWNEKDRMDETGILQYWEDEIDAKKGTDSRIFFELELHFKKLDSQEKAIVENLTAIINRSGGTIENAVRIPEIGFHALKVSMAVQDVAKINDDYLGKSIIGTDGLIKSDHIKYFRPIPQQLSGDDDIPENQENIKLSEVNESPPVTAMFDGFPMSNHNLLKDRLIVDDPDQFGNDYTPEKQQHGTAMASLICHEDLNNPERKSLPRKIYVRPIMKPNELVGKEEIPASEFPEDLLERAIVRIFENPEQEGGVPTIRIVNLSLGNIEHLFLGEMSSWARLLDWLSWKYRVLFIVSSGNYGDDITIAAGDAEISERTIRAMGESIRNRKIISPAESMNALTIGAFNFDYSTIPDNDTRIDVFEEKEFMAEYSRLGSGYRRSIKPDILVEGGRQMFSQTESDNGEVVLRKDTGPSPPGQKSAFVGNLPEDIKNTLYSRGTSNAAAITTHAAGLLYEVIEELREDDPQRIPSEYESVLLKSLLVHSASWKGMKQELDCLKTDVNSRRFKRFISQFLGYGKADFSRVMECTAQRVTMMGFGKLLQKQRHRFILPVPDACRGIHYTLIATLAYLTPINPFHFNYRMAKLFFECPVSNENRQEADHQQVRGGTVQHEILDLQTVDQDIELFVQCNADATDTLEEEIPYALSITLEAEQETDIDIYEEIRQQIATPVSI